MSNHLTTSNVVRLLNHNRVPNGNLAYEHTVILRMAVFCVIVYLLNSIRV